jgi:lipoyl-dependent peroxiredoxin
MALSKAHADWQGTLVEGNGTVSVDSGAFAEQKLSWQARTERPAATTSPEELIAAAHAGCYAMALSHTLAEAGSPAEALHVDAVCEFRPQPEGGFKISSMKLSVHGSVPGIDQARFQDLAEQGEAGCPVSGALRGNVEITLDAKLD